MKKIIYIFIAAVFALPCFGQKAPNPFSPDLIKEFAFDLYQTGFYDEAESEFRRYLFTAGVIIDENAVLTLNSIYDQKNDMAGNSWIFDNFNLSLSPFALEKVSLTKSKLLLHTQDAEAFNDFQQTLGQNADKFSLDFHNIVDISQLVLANNITDARTKAQSATEDNLIFSPLSLYLSDYKTKSPGLALFLSMICPGAGKWYTSSFAQGVSSFLTISSFASACVYSGIKTEWKSWRPYAYGTCGAILYIVDIYGAYQSAKRYNTRIYKELVTNTEKIYEALY